MDCFKNKVGLEIEWNNKDPFLDRDLNNFRLLFELRALAVGVIVTRSDDLTPHYSELSRREAKFQDCFWRIHNPHGKTFAETERRRWRRMSSACFGITSKLFVEDISDEAAHALLAKLKEAKAKKRARKKLTAEEIDLVSAAEENRRKRMTVARI